MAGAALNRYGEWNPQIPWLFEGRRRFAIHRSAEHQVKVTHVEHVHGLLAPLFALFMGGPVEASHHALNQAIRARAENPDRANP